VSEKGCNPDEEAVDEAEARSACAGSEPDTEAIYLEMYMKQDIVKKAGMQIEFIVNNKYSLNDLSKKFLLIGRCFESQ
jgi:hypothetical protein